MPVMYKKVLIGLVFLLICIKPIAAQCFGGDSLLKRINFQRESSKLSFEEQIKELSRYEAGMAGCVYKHDSVHAMLFSEIGSLYSSLKNFPKAIQYYRKAIDLISLNASKPSVNLKHLITDYSNLSAIYDSLHRPVEKMKALDSCIAIAIRLKYIDLYCLKALYAWIKYSFDIGDYHRCINYANLCESFAMQYARNGSKKDFDLGSSFAWSSLLWRLNALIFLKDYEAAENMLESKAEECEKNGHKNYLGVIYGSLAEVLVFSGNCEKALLYHNKAYAIEKISGSAFNCKAMLNGVAHDIYINCYKNADKALDYYRRALNYKVNEEQFRVVSSMESLSILSRIGDVFVSRNQYDSAFRYMQLAFDQIKPGINEIGVLNSSLDDFFRQKRIRYIATLIIDKAEAFHQKYKATGDLDAIKEAIRIYKVADQFLERIKNEQFDERSKLFWRSDKRRLYERAIEACYADGNMTDIFYFFERSRAVLLYDQFNEQRWLKEEDIVKQTQIRRIISQSEKELATLDKASARSLELQSKIMSDRQELDRLSNKIKVENPLYYQNFLQTGQISIRDVQLRLLKGNDKLIEFFDGDSAVYSLIITATQVYVDRIDKYVFDHSVTEFISFISDHEKLNKNFDRFVNTSFSLYQLIFQKYSMLPGRIIVSHDSRYFPVEALVTNKSAPPSYLIQKHPVSYTHSAKFLLIDFNTQTFRGTRNLMGIAPVHFRPGLNQASLPGSDISLQTLKANFPDADIRIFKDASKNNFLQKFSQYRIIQLYTHASDNINSGEPGIYFSDSVLYLSDLINEKKPVTKLIVLSACETGTGQWYRGEGVFSFNRGFAALGIPSSVTNLWSVDNQSTYKLTELFYKYLAKGLATDVALQKAKIEFIVTSSKENQMPYYWAATILAGKTDAIELKKTFTWKLLIILLVLVSGLSLVGYRLWIRKKKNNNQFSKTGDANALYS